MNMGLTGNGWTASGYTRADFQGDVLGAVISFGGIEAMLSPRFTQARDLWAERHAALLGAERVAAWEKELGEGLKPFAERMDASFEEIAAAAARLRREAFGTDWEKALLADAEDAVADAPFTIDQSGRLEELFTRKESVLFVLADARWARRMRRDMARAAALGKRCWAASGGDLPDRALLGRLVPEAEAAREARFGADLSQAEADTAFDAGNAFLVWYGESGLSACRNLALPAVVFCAPETLVGRALAGQFVHEGPVCLYVPAGFDLLPGVPMRRRTLASYRDFARLSAQYGDGVYAMDLRELYRRWPEEFFSVYEEDASGLPEGVVWPGSGAEGDWYAAFCRARDEAIARFLGARKGVQALGGWFRLGTLEEGEVPWTNQGEAEGILVHGALIERAAGADVLLSAGEAISPRRELLEEEDVPALQIISNYLFFLTPRLAELYNRLRSDRPGEQTAMRGGHMDYMLYEKDGRRVETFPLYRKACMGLRDDGTFAFFHFRLRGGELRVNGAPICWTAADVDPETPGAAAVYTPYLSRADAGAPRFEYRKIVGAGRVNLVIVQDELLSARDGDVVLPSMGVVVSLEREEGLRLLEEAGLAPGADGYYTWKSAPRLDLRLQEPEEFTPAEWARLRWAYGGGLTLISRGESFFGDEEASRSHLEREGWASPLSCQTQESDIAAPARHPRTGIGLTRDGRLFILVYSGRSSVSAGANYAEMCAIARRLVPDAWEMINVDGGGSAVLGFAVGRRFVEYSWPSTSFGSLAGMVRPVNSLFRVKLR